MKKIFTLLVLFYVCCGQAQEALPQTIAPDFTVTDLNGNSHNLYTYLNAGKTVILEFSSVGCGPCWKYLRTEALADYYKAYGPAGSNEVVVLFLEDSNYDTLSDLQGVSNPPAFGNWIAGTPYPIVLDPNVTALYNINVNPALRLICPNKTMQSIGQLYAPSFYIYMGIYCAPLTGVQNYAALTAGSNGFCTSTGSFEARIKNYGTNPLTAATLTLKANGVVVGTKTFSGNVDQFLDALVAFDPVLINPAATYTAEIETVNGVANHNTAYAHATLPFSFSGGSGIDLDIKVHTYVCPNNMSWKITNSTGDVVATAGPYQGGAGGICGGPVANSVIQHNVTLPATPDCYTLTLMDSNGYGWKNYSGNSPVPTVAGMEIFSNGVSVFSNLAVENFGSSLTFENFLTTSTLGIETPELPEIGISPNPSHGMIYTNSRDISAITIFDMTGKSVFYSQHFGPDAPIDLSALESAVYSAEMITKDHKSVTRKLILHR